MKFLHLRNYDGVGNTEPKGGTTVAYVDHGHGIYSFAVAKCGPHDTYNKKLGRAKAGGKYQSVKHRYVIEGIVDVDALAHHIALNRIALS